MKSGKDGVVVPGLFEDAPIDDYLLTQIVRVAGSTGPSALEKLAAVIVEVIRAEGVKEMKRRGLLTKK